MFEKYYPFLYTWAECEGHLEIGPDYHSSSLLRLLNHGGTVWEDNESDSVEEALERGEAYLKNDFENEYGYKVVE